MKMAEGFEAIVASAGGDPDAAARLMIVDKIDAIVEAQASAISNIEFGKVVVYDGGDGNAVGGFLGGLTQALPSLHDLAKMGGVELPDYLGQLIDEEAKRRKADTDVEPDPPAEVQPAS